MTRIVRIAALILLALSLLIHAPAQAQAERRVALVIGNGAYKDGPLKNPANDARDMAATLRALGFEVILRENASLRQMEDALDEFWKSLKRGGTGLFFFAGHGVQVKGLNYLVPVDARISVEQDVKSLCLDANRVLGRMENAGNGLNIVLLDACRNNPFARSWRSSDQGLAKMDAPTGTLIGYATAPDSVASDGPGKNGVYTQHLLREMRVSGQTIENALKRVRVGVLKDTGRKQTPWESSSLTGDFYFSPGAEDQTTLATKPSLAPKPASIPLDLKAEKKRLADEALQLKREREELTQLQTLQAEREKLEVERQKLAQAKAAAEATTSIKKQMSTATTKEPKPSMSPSQQMIPQENKLGVQTLTITAKNGEACWVGFYEGEKSSSFVIRNGESRRVEFSKSARLRLGNARGVTIRLNDKEYPFSSSPGEMKTLEFSGQSNSETKSPPESALATGLSGKTWTDPVTGMEFVWVPGGSFEMGCGSWTNECYDSEKPLHSVRLSGFWLAKYSVTQEQWQKVMGSNPSYFKRGNTYPVEQVSWLDAKEFIARLNKMGAAQFRLPTEAEWEYAARSGGKHEKFAGGNDIDRVAWYSGNSGSTQPVGTKAPNGLGLYDMTGNVWQWCEDAYSSYPSTSQDNPLITDGIVERVYRGGGWKTEPRHVRASTRAYLSPEQRGYNLGFRLARTD